MTDSTGRIWDLPAKGPVRFRGDVQAPTLGAFGSLQPATRRKIKLDVAGKLVGRDADEEVTVFYDLLKAHWVFGNGVAVDITKRKLRRLLETRLDEEKVTLNQMVRTPLIVHQAAARHRFRYQSGLSFDRPQRDAGQTQRQWRGLDAAWVNKAVQLTEAPKAAHDRLDRAFDVMRGLARPVPMRWLMEVDENDITQFMLLTTKQLRHATTCVKRDEVSLIPDPTHSANAADTQRMIIAAQSIALLQIIRQLAADDIGPLVITAHEVDALEEPTEVTQQMKIAVARHGWFAALEQLGTTPPEALQKSKFDGVQFD